MEENVVSSVFEELAAEQPAFEYATQGQRFANYLIDLVVYYAFNALIGALIGMTLALSGMQLEDITEFFSNRVYTFGIAMVNMLIIYTIIEGASKGRSLGKVITRTVAVKDDFSRITWKDALMRTLCRMIPFEPFSAFGGYPWHDKYTHTHVIKKGQFTFGEPAQ